ncbi:hypothetical protein V8E54_001927 [Elaphomyces granulatus]
MKNQLLLIFASTFIAALASPLEDITNHLAKRQSVECLTCMWLPESRKANKSLEWIGYGSLTNGWNDSLIVNWNGQCPSESRADQYLEWTDDCCLYTGELTMVGMDREADKYLEWIGDSEY